MCELKTRLFAVFAIFMDGKLHILPEKIGTILKPNETIRMPTELYVLPFCTKPVSIRMEVSEANRRVEEYIEALVDYIDKEDPWVKAVFGISGTGEGLVWMPLDLEPDFGVLSYFSFFSYVRCANQK